MNLNYIHFTLIWCIKKNWNQFPLTQSVNPEPYTHETPVLTKEYQLKSQKHQTVTLQTANCKPSQPFIYFWANFHTAVTKQNKTQCKLYKGFREGKKEQKFPYLEGKTNMSPYLDSQFLLVARTSQDSKEILLSQSVIYPNLAHSCCEWSPVHLLVKIEKKNPDHNTGMNCISQRNR